MALIGASRGRTTACPGDLYGQTLRCLAIIQAAVEEAGGTLADVIRTRVFLTDVGRWEEAARAHGTFFADVRPACTFVGTPALLSDDWLVEIEADAYSHSDSHSEASSE